MPSRQLRADRSDAVNLPSRSCEPPQGATRQRRLSDVAASLAGAAMGKREAFGSPLRLSHSLDRGMRRCRVTADELSEPPRIRDQDSEPPVRYRSRWQKSASLS